MHQHGVAAAALAAPPLLQRSICRHCHACTADVALKVWSLERCHVFCLSERHKSNGDSLTAIAWMNHDDLRHGRVMSVLHSASTPAFHGCASFRLYHNLLMAAPAGHCTGNLQAVNSTYSVYRTAKSLTMQRELFQAAHVRGTLWRIALCTNSELMLMECGAAAHHDQTRSELFLCPS